MAKEYELLGQVISSVHKEKDEAGNIQEVVLGFNGGGVLSIKRSDSAVVDNTITSAVEIAFNNEIIAVIF